MARHEGLVSACERQREHFAKFGEERLTAQDVVVIMMVDEAVAKLRESRGGEGLK